MMSYQEDLSKMNKKDLITFGEVLIDENKQLKQSNSSKDNQIRELTEKIIAKDREIEEIKQSYEQEINSLSYSLDDVEENNQTVSTLDENKLISEIKVEPLIIRDECDKNLSMENEKSELMEQLTAKDKEIEEFSEKLAAKDREIEQIKLTHEDEMNKLRSKLDEVKENQRVVTTLDKVEEESETQEECDKNSSMNLEDLDFVFETKSYARPSLVNVVSQRRSKKMSVKEMARSFSLDKQLNG